MKKLIVLCLALCLTGCLTPPSFRRDFANKSGRYTTYKVTDYNDGFRIDMTYYKFELGGVSAKTTFTARTKIKKIARWIAEARKRKLHPIKIENVESSHYFNSATNHSYWKGTLRVYYADK